MWRVGDRKFAAPIRIGQHDRLRVERGILDLAARADDLGDVLFVERRETPRARALHAGLEDEAPGNDVFSRVSTCLISGVALCVPNGTEREVEKIQHVRREIDKTPAARDLGNHAPWKVLGVVIFGRQRLIERDRDESEVADRSTIDELLDLEKARKCATIVGDEERNAGLVAGLDHRLAFGKVARHRLLDIHRLACLRSTQRVRAMRIRWRRNVDRVHVGIVDQGVGIVVPGRHSVPLGVVLRSCAIASHDRDETGVLCLLEGRTALHLSDRATADHSPADRARGHELSSTFFRLASIISQFFCECSRSFSFALLSCVSVIAVCLPFGASSTRMVW